MDSLYRVVPESHWHEALRTGTVPRCAADERHDRVHLNTLADVELAANLWFTAEEAPVVLEIDLHGLAQHVRWETRADPPHGVWPNLYVPALSTSNISRVFSLRKEPDGTGAPQFRLGPAIVR